MSKVLLLLLVTPIYLARFVLLVLMWAGDIAEVLDRVLAATLPSGPSQS